MGLLGRKREEVPPHPRKEPRIDLPLSAENVAAVFAGCADFCRREAALGGGTVKAVLCWLGGMVRTERVNDYVLRPLAQDRDLAGKDMARVMEKIRAGALYNLGVKERRTADEVVFDLIGGSCALFFPGEETALTFDVGSEEKRSISESENEPPLKGPRDSFVESVRTNTALLRRRVRAPELKIRELIVGRQSVTAVDVCWIDGLTDPELTEQVARRVEGIDIDALLATGHLEEYVTDAVRTAFPLLVSTERPDRFAAGIVGGRVGVLVDGLPLGFLAPGTIGQFFKTSQDKAQGWVTASLLTLLRYLCMLTTLLLPALYIAAVDFHLEMLPTQLALSIIAAKQDVPFSTVFEVLLMLVAFEVIQEAGLRLPGPIGQTVSILGGLVVGSAAVEARIVSPVVLIAVAAAGIAGYTMPSQDFAGALRIWRFVLAVLAGVLGLFGVAAGMAVLIGHLASLESFGVAYLTPFAANAGGQMGGHAVLRQPLPKVKLRERALKTRNRRDQG